MGFADAIEAILSQTPAEKQVALFSATMAAEHPPHRADPSEDPREVVLTRQDRAPPRISSRLLDGQRAAQARRAHAHRRSRGVRRHAGVRAHQAVDRRSRRTAAGARLRGRRAERRHPAVDARADRRSAEGRQDRHPRRDRRGRARTRRRAHHARRQLRHALRHRVVRASHRPHGPRRPQRRGDPVHRAARAQPAAPDRTRHAPDDRAAQHARRSTT